jgi:site-specific DNA-methyltransferase (adenine-specific)
MKSEIKNMDCMDFMRQFPDKYFELAIVDPPYGIDADVKNSTNKKQSKNSATKSKKYGEQNWDSKIPDNVYFEELKRVSKNQIVWGANYFGLKGGFLYWHKNVTMPTYSTGELAWLSFQNKIDFLEMTWHGMIQHDMQNKEIRIHPTQKPVKLYRWLLQNYAKQGDKILDTHLGSGSSRIACDMDGFDFWGCELDAEYFKAHQKRWDEYKSQLTIF